MLLPHVRHVHLLQLLQSHGATPLLRRPLLLLLLPLLLLLLLLLLHQLLHLLHLLLHLLLLLLLLQLLLLELLPLALESLLLHAKLAGRSPRCARRLSHPHQILRPQQHRLPHGAPRANPAAPLLLLGGLLR